MRPVLDRTRPFVSTALLFFALAATAIAQRTTWIVDADGGGQFTAIEPAVRGATPGDLIVVRAGTYKGFPVNKSIAIIGDLGAQLQPQSGNVTIVNLPAGGLVSITGLRWNVIATTPLTVQNCRGHVVLDRLTATVNAANFATPAIRVIDSAQVTVSECTIAGGPGIFALRSRITLQNSQISGHPAFTRGSGYPAQPAVVANTSRVFMAGGQLIGGQGSPNLRPGVALDALGAQLRIGGDGNTELRAGDGSGLSATAVLGAGGRLTIDPSVALTPFSGAPPITGTINVVSERVPVLTGGAGRVGQTLLVDLFAVAGQPYAILLGLPGDATPILDWGELWLDLGLPNVVVRSGTVGGSEHVVQSFGIPNNPDLRGTVLAWQALTLPSGSTLRFSNAFTHSID